MPPHAAGAGRQMLLPDRLIRGYASFLEGRFVNEQERFRHLAAEGQSPRIMLIGCCDSRVSPEVIFDARPGELFIIRNIANLVPPYGPNDDLHGTSAALEFGVMALGVDHIVVMGHASCGGIRAFAANEVNSAKAPLSAGDFIGKWISLVAPAAGKIQSPEELPFDEYAEQLGQASVAQSLQHLRSFPWIAERERVGRLTLSGAYFGIADGTLLALDEDAGRFETVKVLTQIQAHVVPERKLV